MSFTLSPTLYAQGEKLLGAFETLSFDIHLKNKWSLYVESEVRSVYPLSGHYYYEVKLGVKYKLNPYVKFTTALGVYNSFTNGFEHLGIKKQVQYRFWQQIAIKQKFFAGDLDHRIRVEEILNQNFRPVLRYRIQPKWPLNKMDISKGALFATASDEVYLQTEKPVFSRNRIFAGFGYKLSDAITLQLGVMQQSDYKISGNYKKNFIYLSGSVGI